MGKFDEIEKFMKELDAKYQKKWNSEKKDKEISVDLHINKDEDKEVNND